MALSPLVIFSLLIAASSVFASSAAFGGRKALAPAPAANDVAPVPIPDGHGSTLLNSKDPKVLELAKFAVGEYNKTNKSDLVFYSVMEAISTPKDGGISYEFVVATTQGSNFTSYSFNVFVSNDTKKLVSSAQF